MLPKACGCLTQQFLVPFSPLPSQSHSAATSESGHDRLVCRQPSALDYQSGLQTWQVLRCHVWAGMRHIIMVLTDTPGPM